MTAFRLVSLPAHGALELLIGFLTMAAPFVLGLSGAATVVGVVVGALLVGLSLGAAVAGISPIDIAAHHAYDLGIALGLVGAAIVFAVAGDPRPGALFAAAGAAQLALNVTTRYSVRGG